MRLADGRAVGTWLHPQTVYTRFTVKCETCPADHSHQTQISFTPSDNYSYTEKQLNDKHKMDFVYMKKRIFHCCILQLVFFQPLWYDDRLDGEKQP